MRCLPFTAGVVSERKPTAVGAGGLGLFSERVRDHLREFYEQLAPHRREPVALAFEARLRELLPPVSRSLRP